MCRIHTSNLKMYTNKGMVVVGVVLDLVKVVGPSEEHTKKLSTVGVQLVIRLEIIVSD